MCLSGVRSSAVLLGMDVFSEYKGAFTENFVLSQIKSLEKRNETERVIFYYSKDNSTQEVDFVVQGAGRIIPAEVKAEENVHAKSLRTFIEENASSSLKGVRLRKTWMENVPLYAAEAYFRHEGIGIMA